MAEQSWLEELPLEKCLHLLRRFSVGRIAVIVDDAPIILPINYRLVETTGRTWIALRTRPGNVIDQASLHVAFEIDGLDPIHQEGWSVLVRGTLHHVDAAAASFGERFDPEPWMLAEREVWLVIEPLAITGRRLHAPEREWAFQINAYL
jgi:nitroimidazol reductase NimA-like FMN-containing flavoprotein (pyridoxamine 5'-phosphate oxidase superfamily)